MTGAPACVLRGERGEWTLVDERVREGDTAANARVLAIGSDGVHPGAVNAHTHLYSGLAPLGMPLPDPAPADFLGILARIWWRLDRALDAPSLRAAARLYLAEALLAGTTTVVDHHESPGMIEGSLDILADAAEELGIRVATCYGATERNGGRDEARRGLAECGRLASSRRGPLVRAMVGLHASFTASDDTIAEAGALATELGVVTHVHVAEDRADVVDARRRGDTGPLERLARLGALPRGSILAHGVHLDEQQVARAAAAGWWLVHNPRSNEGNRVGYARALGASTRVALGTDGWPSQMGAEQAALARIARAEGDENWRPRPIDARPLSPQRGERQGEGPSSLAAVRFEAGRQLAAELFDLPSDVADLVIAPEGWPAVGGPVRHVIVAGRVVVEDGALVTADLEEIRRRAHDEAPRLWRRMEAIA